MDFGVIVGTYVGLAFRPLPGLTSTALAVGSPLGYIGVNGNTATGTAAIDGTFNSGTMTLTCSTPVGVATISLNGCAITADFPDPIVNDGPFDTGAGPKYFNVVGSSDFPAGCVKVSAMTAFARPTSSAPASSRSSTRSSRPSAPSSTRTSS